MTATRPSTVFGFRGGLDHLIDGHIVRDLLVGFDVLRGGRRLKEVLLKREDQEKWLFRLIAGYLAMEVVKLVLEKF